MKKSFDPIIPVQDDGLQIQDVGEWSAKKNRLVGHYCNMFTQGMHTHFENLVYIDLYSGSGYSQLRESKKVILGSPLIALSIKHPFTHYIFCEEDKMKFDSLQQRVKRDFNHIENRVKFFNGDCVKLIDEIESKIPPFSKNNRVLTMCFVDPYDIGIDFNIIKKLSLNRKVDFINLLAFGMDANRWYKDYLKDDDKTIDRLLQNPSWRTDFRSKKYTTNSDFIKFIADGFIKKMKTLGYTFYEEVYHNFAEVRSSAKNLPLYHLAYFSKHPMGNEYWKVIKARYLNETGSFNF